MFNMKVDKRSKKAMVDFLDNHFHYFVANPWNGSIGYAHNVKIYNVIPTELQDIAYEMLDDEFFYYDVISPLLRKFVEKYHCYKIGMNGRSSGYFVLYNSEYPYRGTVIDTEECNFRELQETTEMVQFFDKVCSNAIAEIIKYLKTLQ